MLSQLSEATFQVVRDLEEMPFEQLKAKAPEARESLFEYQVFISCRFRAGGVACCLSG